MKKQTPIRYRQAVAITPAEMEVLDRASVRLSIATDAVVREGVKGVVNKLAGASREVVWSYIQDLPIVDDGVYIRSTHIGVRLDDETTKRAQELAKLMSVPTSKVVRWAIRSVAQLWGKP